MNITYYTIDDLRKGHDEKGVTSWKLSRFLGRHDAFLYYRSLPRSGIKALGIRSGDRHHIAMRGCRYTAPPLTPTGCVVC